MTWQLPEPLQPRPQPPRRVPWPGIAAAGMLMLSGVFAYLMIATWQPAPPVAVQSYPTVIVDLSAMEPMMMQLVTNTAHTPTPTATAQDTPKPGIVYPSCKALAMPATPGTICLVASEPIGITPTRTPTPIQMCEQVTPSHYSDTPCRYGMKPTPNGVTGADGGI